MKFTGERFMPDFPCDWGSEHLHRYMFARDLCAGKTVLDVASGEGYGSMMLAEAAQHVTGVDISDETVCFAREKYQRDNLVYTQGSAAALPFADNSFDVVVSYETIEHLTEQDAMMDELARVLRPEGLLIISSPDKHEYTEVPNHQNEYHVKELYRAEFEALLRARFPHIELYGQRLDYGSLIAGETTAPFLSYDAEGNDVTQTAGLSHAMFHIALASRVALPTPPHSIRKFPLLEAEAVRPRLIELNDWKTHALALEKVAAEREAALERVGAELTSGIAELAVSAAALAATRQRLDACHADLQVMRNSLSWRLTDLCRKSRPWVNRFVLACCLFPASFALYPSPREWFAALCGGNFFGQIQSRLDTLLEQLGKRSRVWRLLARKPLCFAQQILWHGGVFGAARACYRMYRPVDVTPPAPHLREPSGIDLLPGLAAGTPEARAQAQALLAGLPQLPISIAAHTQVVFGADVDFTDTTTAVVAHWDPEGLVRPHVRHMCRAFKAAGWRVVLASVAPLADPDVDALQNGGPVVDWVDAVVCRTCDGGDFTSWKAALHGLPTLYACRELVLCNDRVFGGIGSYAQLHERMSRVACDFWGITASAAPQPHLQSYYLAFRPTALGHAAFRTFFDRVLLSRHPEISELFEHALALWLAEQGLRPAAFAPVDSALPAGVDPSCAQWRSLIEAGVPLLKCGVLLDPACRTQLRGWGDLLAARGYPLQLVLEYCERMGVGLEATQCYADTTQWPPSVLALRTELPLPEAPPTLSPEKSSGIGVFLHIFYTDLADEMLDCVDNLPAGVFVHVSTDTEAKRDALLAVFARRGYAERSEIKVFPNVGWDIAPFLVGYGETIRRYSLILRMHSKRSVQIPGDVGEKWRQMLYTSLAGTPERVNAIVDGFERNPALGMVCPPLVPHYADCVHFGGNFARMRALLLRRGVLITPDTAIDFPMGSMFWCRPQALSPWIEPGFTFDDFTPSMDVESERDCTLAHALERLFFFGCGLQGLTWSRIPALSTASSTHD